MTQSILHVQKCSFKSNADYSKSLNTIRLRGINSVGYFYLQKILYILMKRPVVFVVNIFISFTLFRSLYNIIQLNDNLSILVLHDKNLN
jgi:hypothetical protein